MGRTFPILFAAVVAVVPSGCNWLKSPSGLTNERAPAPVEPLERPAKHFVDYLNRQASYLNTVRYDDLDLDVTIPGQWVPGLNNGMIVCGKPNNFRMFAGVIAGRQIDVGSNADEMWMYVRQSDPQYLFCSHTEFSKVQDALPVKFEPAWVLQALGMSTYDPAREYQIQPDTSRQAYFLSYPDTTAAGDRVLKVTEFAMPKTSGTLPQVRRHFILSEDRKQVIATAIIKKVSVQNLGPDAEVEVPTELTLEWPQQNVKMDFRLGRIKVNESLTTTEFDNLFRRPNSIGSARPVNLAEYLSSSPRSAGGVARGSRPDYPTSRR